jgi:transposase
MDQKFTMGILLYRQEQQWKRNGVDIPRQTLLNWVVDNALMWLFPIWLLMKQYLLKQDIIKRTRLR